MKAYIPLALLFPLLATASDFQPFTKDILEHFHRINPIEWMQVQPNVSFTSFSWADWQSAQSEIIQNGTFKINKFEKVFVDFDGLDISPPRQIPQSQPGRPSPAITQGRRPQSPSPQRANPSKGPPGKAKPTPEQIDGHSATYACYERGSWAEWATTELGIEFGCKALSVILAKGTHSLVSRVSIFRIPNGNNWVFVALTSYEFGQTSYKVCQSGLTKLITDYCKDRHEDLHRRRDLQKDRHSRTRGGQLVLYEPSRKGGRIHELGFSVEPFSGSCNC